MRQCQAESIPRLPESYVMASILEDQPGPRWQANFDACWPQYKTWFLSQGQQARPGYMTSSGQLRQYMPELMPVYEQLVTLAGGGDLAARFLSFYRPPPYLLGCSQSVWQDSSSPSLIRNYDYSPLLFEWTLLRSRWLRPVMAITDCLWGALDGMNDAGLAASLAFGGSKSVGDGFGVPLILRYVLETCDTVSQACEVLRRVPVHMAYNVTLLDDQGNFTTAYLAPGRKPRFTLLPVSTNHQDRIVWPDYARMSASIQRRRFLEDQLARGEDTRADFINRFLRPPIYRTRYAQAFGTLYTAVYHPAERVAEYHWPGAVTLRQSIDRFQEGRKVIRLRESGPRPGPDLHSRGIECRRGLNVASESAAGQGA